MRALVPSYVPRNKHERSQRPSVLLCRQDSSTWPCWRLHLYCSQTHPPSPNSPQCRVTSQRWPSSSPTARLCSWRGATATSSLAQRLGCRSTGCSCRQAPAACLRSGARFTGGMFAFAADDWASRTTFSNKSLGTSPATAHATRRRRAGWLASTNSQGQPVARTHRRRRLAMPANGRGAAFRRCPTSAALTSSMTRLL